MLFKFSHWDDPWGEAKVLFLVFNLFSIEQREAFYTPPSGCVVSSGPHSSAVKVHGPLKEGCQILGWISGWTPPGPGSNIPKPEDVREAESSAWKSQPVIVQELTSKEERKHEIRITVLKGTSSLKVKDRPKSVMLWWHVKPWLFHIWLFWVARNLTEKTSFSYKILEKHNIKYWDDNILIIGCLFDTVTQSKFQNVNLSRNRRVQHLLVLVGCTRTKPRLNCGLNKDLIWPILVFYAQNINSYLDCTSICRLNISFLLNSVNISAIKCTFLL